MTLPPESSQDLLADRSMQDPSLMVHGVVPVGGGGAGFGLGLGVVVVGVVFDVVVVAGGGGGGGTRVVGSTVVVVVVGAGLGELAALLPLAAEAPPPHAAT